MNDIHVKAELGPVSYARLLALQEIPRWDDSAFLPGTLTRFVIEGYREKCGR